MSSEFQNLIKTESIGSITPAQILDAGSNIFFDVQTSPDINAINKAIPAYANIHAPIYGQPIPLSGKVVYVVGAETLLAPSANEVHRILAINATHTGGGAPIVFDITLGGMIISVGNTVTPAGTVNILTGREVFADNNLPLAVSVTSGTVGDLTSSVASILVTQ